MPPGRSAARVHAAMRTADPRTSMASAATLSLLVLLLPLVITLGLTGCSGGSSSDGDGWRPRATSSNAPFWVNPRSSPVRQVNRWERQGRTREARLLKRIAEQPVAEWISDDTSVSEVSALAGKAADAGSTALLVAYNIPHRDCGQYSTGGAHDSDAYRGWLARFAEGIGDRRAVVVLEPDAVPHMVDGCTPEQFHAQRQRLLREAVSTFKALPRTRVYLDAGNSGWIKDPGALVEPLKRAGVHQADGFALNVSNFQTTEASRRYGHRLSAVLGGAHFVIDTSRNGRGPLHKSGEDRRWCNPPGRGLGPEPTEATGDPLVDAYLWVKPPGESDGACRGAPAAGRWWPGYALELADNAVTGASS